MLNTNPVRGVKFNKEMPRDRYVTDNEYVAVQRLATPVLKVAMDLALLTGLRRGDLLRLQWRDIINGRMYVSTGKSGKKVAIEVTPELQEVLGRARGLPGVASMHVLSGRQGQRYTSHGFSSMWQRLMRKSASELGMRFRFADLRAKSATDDFDEHEAARRLAHGAAVSKRHYQRLPTKVRPLQREK